MPSKKIRKSRYDIFYVISTGEHVDLAINKLNEKIGEVTSDQSTLNSAFIRVINSQGIMKGDIRSLQSQASLLTYTL